MEMQFPIMMHMTDNDTIKIILMCITTFMSLIPYLKPIYYYLQFEYVKLFSTEYSVDIRKSNYVNGSKHNNNEYTALSYIISKLIKSGDIVPKKTNTVLIKTWDKNYDRKNNKKTRLFNVDNPYDIDYILDDISTKIKINGKYIKIESFIFTTDELISINDKNSQSFKTDVYRISGDEKTVKYFIERTIAEYEDYDILNYNKIVIPLDADGYRIIDYKYRQTIKNTIMTKDVYDKLIPKLDFMINFDKLDLKRLGIPRKLVILLEGPPGTGKSSISKMIASYLKLKTVIINDITKIAFDNYINNQVVIVDEVDEIFNNVIQESKRDEKEQKDIKSSNNSSTIIKSVPSNVLTKVLALFDGTLLNNVVFVLTTNYIERLDPKIYRDQRVDLVLHVGNMDLHQCKLLHKLYLKETIDDKKAQEFIDKYEISTKFISYLKKTMGI